MYMGDHNLETGVPTSTSSIRAVSPFCLLLFHLGDGVSFLSEPRN